MGNVTLNALPIVKFILNCIAEIYALKVQLVKKHNYSIISF